MSRLSQIVKLIATDKIDVAIKKILQNKEERDKDLKNEVVLIKGRVESLEKNLNRGIIDPDNAILERNRIRNDFLGLITRAINKPEYVNQQKRASFRLILIGVIYTIATGLLIWLAFAPTSSIHLQGEFQVSKVSFSGGRLSPLINRQKLEWIDIQNFDLINFRSDSLAIDKNFNGNFEKRFKGDKKVNISPSEALNSGVRLRMTNVMLNQTYFKDSVQVAISHTSQGSKTFKLDIQQKSPFTGELSYRGETELISDYVDLSIVGERENEQMSFDEAFSIIAYTTSNQARLVNFKTLPYNTSIEVKPNNSLYTDQPIYINDLQFLKTEGHAIISSIKDGQVVIQEPNKEVWDTISFGYPLRLELEEKNPIEVTSIRLDEEGIWVKFKGDVNEFYTYDNKERVNLKPKLYQWLWHNHRSLMIAIGIAIFTFLFFLPGDISKRIVNSIMVIRKLILG